MKKFTRIKAGRIEEITLIVFFILFFVLTMIAQSYGQVNGNSGHCREFNGSTSGVSFTKNDPGLSAKNTMTVTAWVKCISSSASGNWAGIVNLNDSSSNGDNGQFWLQHSQLNTQFEFAVENNSGNRAYVQSTTTPADGVWYHVAGVYDGSYIYIYVNGVMENKTVQTGKINNFSSTFKMVFGQWAYSGNSYRRFNGDIDEVTLWNTALTQTQIRTYMCKKLTGTETGLIGYWRMNETSGSYLYDVTTNARTGKASNATIVWSGAPIGDASNFTYGGTSVSISQPTNKDSLVASNFSSTPTGVQVYRIDTTENYTVAPSGYTVMVTTYYYGVFVCDQSGANFKMLYYYGGNPSVTTPSNAGIATRNDNSVLSWSDLGAALNTSKGYFQKGGQKNRAEYTIALKTNPLPVRMESFTGKQENTTVVLNWTTATEINNDHFTVQRTTDGINYETIGTVKGAGNSDFELNYSITDNNPQSGTAYYRLIQTDYDGTSKTYGPVAVDFVSQSTASFSVENVYPSVFTNNVTVNLVCENDMDLMVNMVSLNGNVSKQRMVHGSKGNNQIEVDGAGLGNGMYALNIYDASTGHVVSSKIIKQ